MRRRAQAHQLSKSSRTHLDCPRAGDKGRGTAGRPDPRTTIAAPGRSWQQVGAVRSSGFIGGVRLARQELGLIKVSELTCEFISESNHLIVCPYRLNPSWLELELRINCPSAFWPIESDKSWLISFGRAIARWIWARSCRLPVWLRRLADQPRLPAARRPELSSWPAYL